MRLLVCQRHREYVPVSSRGALPLLGPDDIQKRDLAVFCGLHRCCALTVRASHEIGPSYRGPAGWYVEPDAGGQVPHRAQ